MKGENAGQDMRISNSPPSESTRIQELQSYEILDTPSEEGFDRITKLASSICGTPISFVSLIDSDRQWFKASHGSSLKETSRDISFCTHTIEQDDVFEICDALADPQFADNPLVTQAPQIRFYAGAPLKSPRGQNLGTVCVIDVKPHSLTLEQKNLLKLLAQQVVDLLESRQREKLLVSKAKMQSVGEIITGVCHHINNPLAIISGRSMMLKSLSQEKSIHKEVEVIEKTTYRISEIIRALRLFANQNHGEIVEVSVEAILSDALLLCKSHEANPLVEIEEKIQTRATSWVDKVQVNYAILVVLNNAFEAIEQAEIKKISIEVRERNKFVDIYISDTGPGIAAENQHRIFNPFFTTKTKNFGIGLAQAKLAIEEARGELVLEKPKDPTTFRICLPIMHTSRDA